MWFPRRYGGGNGRPNIRNPGPVEVVGDLGHGRLGWLIASMNDQKTKHLTWWLKNAAPATRAQAVRHGITPEVILTHGWRTGFMAWGDGEMSTAAGFRLVDVYANVPGVRARTVINLLFKCASVRPAISMHMKFPGVLSSKELVRRLDKDQILAIGHSFSSNGSLGTNATSYRDVMKVSALRDLVEVDRVMDA